MKPDPEEWLLRIVKGIAAIQPVSQKDRKRQEEIALALTDLAEGRAILDYSPPTRMVACLFYAAAVSSYTRALGEAPNPDEFARIVEKTYTLADLVAVEAV